jgi:tetratricopeptide (TPR) repeat protein
VCGTLGLHAVPALGQTVARPATPEELRWQADRLFDQQRFDEARDAYLKIYPAFANDPELNRDLGWAFYRARQPDIRQAIRYWTVSWRVDGKEDLKVEAARAYARLGQWQSGATLLLELAAQHPNHPEHWRQLADVAESAREFAQAEAWYRAYLERRPADAPARVALARLLGWAKKFPEAIAEYEVVLKIDRRSTPARLGIAQVLAWKGDLEESLRRYDDVLAEQPANLDAQKGKAFALLWIGRSQEARPLFETVARRRPADQEVRAALKEVARLAQVAATAPAGVPAAPPDPLEILRGRVEEALQRKDAPAAEALVREGLELAPGDVALRRLLVQAYIAADRLNEALTLLETLVSEQPERLEMLRELASLQVRTGRLDAAVESLSRYLTERPDDRSARVDMARVMSWSRQFEQASREYRRVLEADPGNIEGEVGLAQVEAWQGRYGQALDQFDRILARSPDQREALIGRAQSLFWTGRRDEAVDLLARVAQQFPGDREIASLAADLREAQRQQTTTPQNVEESIAHYREILDRQPDDAGALQMLGDLHAGRGDYSEAVVYYRQARGQRPDDAPLQLAMARALSAAKAFEESATLYRDLLAREPGSVRRVELAQVLSSAQQYEQAVAEYAQVIAEQPDDLDARLAMARILSWSRRYDESLSAYRALIERAPSHREARVEYARVHAWKGDLDAAIQLFSDLELTYPQDHDVLLGKGQSLQWSGRPREAQKVLATLRMTYPDDRDVRIAMAGTQLALGRSDLALRELEAAGDGALADANVQSMRSLALRQLRPVFVVSYSPSKDSDDLEILPLTGTLYFTPVPRVRSHLRGVFTPSTMPAQGSAQGREAVVGSTVQIAPGVVGRGEIGANIGSEDRNSLIGSGGVTWLPSPKVRLDFDAGRQFLNYLPLSYHRDISRVGMRAGLDYRPTRRLLLHTDYSHARYSDANDGDLANVVATYAVTQRSRVTLESGYLYSISGFAEQTGSGYYAPSRLERHAGLVNLSGRARPWLGYYVAGTLGIEREADAPFRVDGSIRFSVDFSVGDRLTLSTGYGYSRVASLTRSGAYAYQGVTGGLEIRF